MFDFLSDPKVAEQIGYLAAGLPLAIWETLYSTIIATLLAYLIGLPLGVLLVTGEVGGIHPLPKPIMSGLNMVINLLRSVPFLILMVVVIPLSRMLLGTSIGTPATIVPLVVAAFPFVARLVESSLRELDRGVLEAAQSMGASPLQIVSKVMLPESRPSLITGFVTALITILSYGAMSAAIGGGGLGSLALNLGYGRNKVLVLYVSVILLVVIVQIFQSLGTRLSTRLDKRVGETKTRKVKRETLL